MELNKHIKLENFDSIYVADSEFKVVPGNLPTIICFVLKELKTGKMIRIFGESLYDWPIEFRDSDLFVAYSATAELLCLKTLGVPYPKNILDLFVEFKLLTNGFATFGEDGDDSNFREPAKGLLDALKFFNLPSIGSDKKDLMRELIIHNEIFSESDINSILDYCASDVLATEELLKAMKGYLDFPRALVRGQFCIPATEMEFNGLPIDIHTKNLIQKNWPSICSRLIIHSNSEVDLLNEKGSLVQAKISELVKCNKLSWPLTGSGKYCTDNETLKMMAVQLPSLEKVRQIRKIIPNGNVINFPVSTDNRNRRRSFSFGTKTGRNAPKASEFMLTKPAALRFLLKPSYGCSLVILDWEQQEFGIGAAISEDSNMKKAYTSGDPYLEFAKIVGVIPRTAKKEDYPEIREHFKQCVLGMAYGMGAKSLAMKINKSEAVAKRLIEHHQTVFPKFWEFRENFYLQAQMNKKVETKLGWRLKVNQHTKPRTLYNFPMQANGAEMLRLASIYAYEVGLKICATLHDSIIVECSTENVDTHSGFLAEAMARASSELLNGFVLRTEATIISYPNRYEPKKNEARKIWHLMCELARDCSMIQSKHTSLELSNVQPTDFLGGLNGYISTPGK